MNRKHKLLITIICVVIGTAVLITQGVIKTAGEALFATIAFVIAIIFAEIT